MLKNYLASLPINVLKKTRITSTEVKVPTKIDPIEFYKLMSEEINSTTLTPEKAIYIASREVRPQYSGSIALLNSKLKI